MSGMLEARDIHYTYPDGTSALKGIDFHAEKGEFIGILGGNGSGKTTLLRILNGLLKAADGSVLLKNENIKFIRKDKLFSTVCTMFQNPNDQLFSPTVGEDIAFGPKNMGLSQEEVQRRVRDALSAVGMAEFHNKAVNALSYGQKKKVCLAGVLAMDPEVILLDEPTASLDPAAVNSIMNLLKTLNIEKNITMIMTTHSVDLVPIFIDRAVILNNGKVMASGSPKEIFTDTDTLQGARLRLPQMGHLFETLKKKDLLEIDEMALTIGEARDQIKNLVSMKKGFTTGTAAQAAAKAAFIMLTKREICSDVEIKTPKGENLKIAITDQAIEGSSARCAVIKDSGSDPDVTDKAKICAEVNFSKTKGIFIKGGKGVGRITRPGLALGVGEWAINPMPRKMIQEELSALLPPDKGLEVTISVPGGEELAKKTFNPKLGIIGGISIIGTTGIVEPKSLDAYKASLALELDVLKAAGAKKITLVLGYVGERFAIQVLKINADSLIKIGDHVGFMLEQCVKKDIKEILLIGHIGKLIKVANGQFNTHYSSGDERMSVIARYAKEAGAGEKVIQDILKQATAEATIEILKRSGKEEVFKKIARDVSKKCAEFTGNKLRVDCVVLSLNAEELARA